MSTESEDVDSSGNYKQALKNEPRITKVGAFLRKTNFDEMNQLFEKYTDF